MTVVDTDDPEVWHNVVIVGYHPDETTYIYMNPATGTLQEADESEFKGYAIVVTGTKGN
jgi:hypothetical protein